MPRHARLVVEGIPLHIIQRGNNRNPCFFSESDYLVYLDMLGAGLKLSGCRLHAYVLMRNHIHLLVSPDTVESAGLLMKALGERYVPYINKRYKRAGTLWQGRFRSCLVEDEEYLLTCHRYIELNPVRATMAQHPAHYKWSSHRSNAYGTRNGLLTRHAIYDRLGNDEPQRHRAYRRLFESELPEEKIEEVRKATNSNFALGSTDFGDRMATILGQPVRARTPGRPCGRTGKSVSTKLGSDPVFRQ
jgi:putative transposase